MVVASALFQPPRESRIWEISMESLRCGLETVYPVRPQMTPQQEILFDATGDMSEKEMEKVLEMVEWIKTFRK